MRLFGFELFSLEGRMNRAPYIKFLLAVLFLTFVLDIVLGAILALISPALTFLLVFILLVVAAVLGLTACVRRLHDLNRSGFWYLLFLVPVVNVIMAFCLMLLKGTTGENRYGPDPLG